MAIREYKCENCGLKEEKILPISATPPPSTVCKRCGKDAKFLSIPTSVGIITSNFSERKLDVAVGADAERRWDDIHKRQEIRDKIRQQTGQMGLTMVGRNEFIPIKESARETRTGVAEAVSESGFKATGDTPFEKQIAGSD